MSINSPEGRSAGGCPSRSGSGNLAGFSSHRHDRRYLAVGVYGDARSSHPTERDLGGLAESGSRNRDGCSRQPVSGSKARDLRCDLENNAAGEIAAGHQYNDGASLRSSGHRGCEVTVAGLDERCRSAAKGNSSGS